MDSSHYFISKELVDTFSLNIMTLMTSLRIVNSIDGSATLSLLCKNVEIILCDYSFRADLHVMRYLGFGIDFWERIGLIIIKPISYVLRGLSIFDILNLLSRFLIFLNDFDSNLMASFYSLNPHDEEDVISLIQLVCEFFDIFEPVLGLPAKRSFK